MHKILPFCNLITLLYAHVHVRLPHPEGWQPVFEIPQITVRDPSQPGAVHIPCGCILLGSAIKKGQIQKMDNHQTSLEPLSHIL